MSDLDDLDFYASDPKAKNKITAALETALCSGIQQIYASGYDLNLKECELVWKPTASRSAHILGLEVSELPHRWYLVHKRRQIEIDMNTLKLALKKAWLARQNDEE